VIAANPDKISPKKVAFKNITEENNKGILKKKNKSRGISNESSDSDKGREVARQAKIAANEVAKKRGEKKSKQP
jgi:hypothetical protein